MVEEKKPHEERISIPGIFLVFLGMIFLLQSFKILPWDLWVTLGRFWPVLLIIAGLNVLLKRFNDWLVSLLIVAILLACLGIAIWQQEKPLPSGPGARSYSVPSESLAMNEPYGVQSNSISRSPTATGNSRLLA